MHISAEKMFGCQSKDKDNYAVVERPSVAVDHVQSTQAQLIAITASNLTEIKGGEAEVGGKHRQAEAISASKPQKFIQQAQFQRSQSNQIRIAIEIGPAREASFQMRCMIVHTSLIL